MTEVWTAIVFYSDWLALGTSATCAWFMGSKKWWAPWIGLSGQVFWVILALSMERYGLLVNTAIFTFLGFRNSIRWTRDEMERRKRVAHG